MCNTNRLPALTTVMDNVTMEFNTKDASGVWKLGDGGIVFSGTFTSTFDSELSATFNTLLTANTGPDLLPHLVLNSAPHSAPQLAPIKGHN